MTSRNLQDTLNEVAQTLAAASFEQAQFEARQLVQDCLDLTFAQLLSQPERELTPEQLTRLTFWTTERARGVPLAYLARRRGFYKYDFLVEPGLLVPRPETEMVVETALRRSEECARVINLADLGCGTGCIGLSLLCEMSQLNLWAVDRDPLAVKVTAQNAAALFLTERVTPVHAAVERWEPGRYFDMVVANPPYISENDTAVEKAVRKFEPAHALFSGEDGFEALRQWTAWANRNLKPGGLFVCEFGATQGRLMQDLLARHSFTNIQLERDLSGHDRVISALKRGGA